MIELRTINEDNFEQCFNLKASVENESFIDSVTYSLAEAWVFYKDTRPFLIDDAFQKKGLGTKAAKACIHFLKNEYGAKRISAPVELKK